MAENYHAIPKPPYFSLVTPYIIVSGISMAIDFYRTAFGFSLKEKVLGKDGEFWHAEMFYHDQLLMFGKEGCDGSPVKSPRHLPKGQFSPMNLYLYCDNVDDYYQKALSLGALPFKSPMVASWGDRLCQLLCIEGYIWTFARYSGVCHQKN